MAGKVVSRRLVVKAKKHDEIRVLALGKLNTITDHVIHCLIDDEISDHEFRLIQDEVEKYHHIRAGAHAAVLTNLSDGVGTRIGHPS